MWENPKPSSSKELRVITPKWNPQSPTFVDRITMRVRTLYDASVGSISHRVTSIFWKSSSKVELIVLPNTQNNPLEELMNSIDKGVDTLSDESIITLARGLHSMFWNWVQRERKTKIDYINTVIMPLVWEDEKLPTILIGDPDTIIERFGILIKIRVAPIMKGKIARLK